MSQKPAPSKDPKNPKPEAPVEINVEALAPPTADDVVAIAKVAVAEAEHSVEGIEVTGPHSATIMGSAHGVADILAALRYHGGSVTANDGSVLHGPITGQSTDENGVARITVSFPIERPANADA